MSSGEMSRTDGQSYPETSFASSMKARGHDARVKPVAPTETSTKDQPLRARRRVDQDRMTPPLDAQSRFRVGLSMLLQRRPELRDVCRIGDVLEQGWQANA